VKITCRKTILLSVALLAAMANQFDGFFSRINIDKSPLQEEGKLSKWVVLLDDFYVR
jgi:hypothetical protein